jgi:DNA (cytosine-5)-methyltransferase 1
MTTSTAHRRPHPRTRQDADLQEWRFIDLFCGIGGTRLAFERAGARCAFSSEIDRFARETYEANFGEAPTGDITGIDSEDVPNHDILVAGFPCQPFSIAGVSKNGSLGRAHGFQDETRGTLFFEIARLLSHHRPAAFLLENVKNLVSHDRGRTWSMIRKVLEDDLGYFVDWRVLDARVLVPQHRERVFVVGFRQRIPFAWPSIRDHHPKLRDILQKIVDPRYTLTDNLWSYLQGYARKHQELGNGFGFGLSSLDGVARTLSARYYKDGSEILIPQRNANPRRLTPRECARLMGFPNNFVIPVSDTQAYRQFGNSVVVPLVELLAKEIVKSLDAWREDPSIALEAWPTLFPPQSVRR